MAKESWQKCFALHIRDEDGLTLAGTLFELKGTSICAIVSETPQWNAKHNSPLALPMLLIEVLQEEEIRQVHYYCVHTRRMYVANADTIQKFGRYDKEQDAIFVPEEKWRMFSGDLPYEIPEVTEDHVLNPEQNITPRKKIEPYIPCLVENDPLEELSLNW